MQQLLLLHGAIGAKDQLEPLKKMLGDSFTVHSLNFTGHGGVPVSQFSIKQFAEDVLRYLDEQDISSINIFGYSMGGYVAMYLAKNHPGSINSIITLATKFAWDEQIAAGEVKMLNAEKIAEKLPAFAATLEKRHVPNDWKVILQNTASMLLEMGKDNPLKPEDYKAIRHNTLIMLGDRDKLVSLAETMDVYHSLPNAQLAILPKTAHPIEAVSPERLAYEISSFLMGNQASVS